MNEDERMKLSEGIKQEFGPMIEPEIIGYLSDGTVWYAEHKRETPNAEG